MWIDPAGWPFVGAAVLVAAALGWFFGWLGAAPGLVVAVLFLLFFRDPEREVGPIPITAVLSPADGRVMVAGAPTGERTPAGAWRQITIFLSLLDVHVNRMPVAGRVTRVQYHPGRFLPAYKPEAGYLNEHTEVWIEHAGQTIVVRQIVGLLARRIVCRVVEGDIVEAGQRFGVMKFGSRMDVFVPPGTEILVARDDKVVAGVTRIARLPAEPVVGTETHGP
jgi:phosphatidylserine decarboxylase